MLLPGTFRNYNNIIKEGDLDCRAASGLFEFIIKGILHTVL